MSIEGKHAAQISEAVKDIGKHVSDFKEASSKVNQSSNSSTVIIKAAGFGTTLALLIVMSIFMVGAYISLSNRIDTVEGMQRRTQDYTNLIFQKVPQLKKIIEEKGNNERK